MSNDIRHTVRLSFEQRQRAGQLIALCGDDDGDQVYLICHEYIAMADALTALLNHYTKLINSGDAGNWDPEKEPVVIAARLALDGCELPTDDRETLGNKP
jgi:hypothetical protein